MQKVKVDKCIDLNGMGGYLSVGDLDGDGYAEYVFTQGTRSLAAFDQDGSLLWEKRRKQYGQVRVHVECEMPTLVYDIDGDGFAEVITRWYVEDARDAIPFVQILDGKTGEIRKQTALPVNLWPESVNTMAHSGNIVIGRIEHDGPLHLIVGGMCWGLAILDDELRIRFCDPQFGRVHDRMTGFGLCHTPQLFDVDDDGVNELFLGRITCRADSEIIWRIDPEEFSPSQIDHVDSLAVADINNDGRYELAVGNAASLFDAHTGKLLWQRPDLVKHGQQLRIAKVRDDMDGLQILVSDNKSGSVYILSSSGELIEKLPMAGLLNPVVWNGDDLKQIFLGTGIWDGWGSKVASLPLKDTLAESGADWPGGDKDTWGHTMACDVNGDGLEEVIWVNRMRLVMFSNPAATSALKSVKRDKRYWIDIANATRY